MSCVFWERKASPRSWVQSRLSLIFRERAERLDAGIPILLLELLVERGVLEAGVRLEGTALLPIEP